MFFIATMEFLCADTCTPSVPIFFVVAIICWQLFLNNAYVIAVCICFVFNSLKNSIQFTHFQYVGVIENK